MEKKRVGKKRARFGENHPRARIPDEDIELMHAMHDAGMSQREVWRKLDNYDPPLAFDTVRSILRGRRRGRRG